MHNQKKYYLSIFTSIFLMFFWIFVTVILTDGKEMYDFTQQDFLIFGIFILVELITLCALAIFLKKLTNITRPKTIPVKTVPKTKYERAIQRRGSLLIISSVVLTFAFTILGIIFAPHFAPSVIVYFKIIITVSFILHAILITGNLHLKKLHIQKIEQMQVGEAQQFILEHRNSAEEIATKKLTFLKYCRMLTDIYAIFLFVIASFTAFSVGVIYDNNGFLMVFYFLAAFYCLCALSRLRFPMPYAFYEDDKTYVAREDYPELYTLAQKAADALHCNGEIKIAILGDCNAGIAKSQNIYSVQLGAILINLLSEEELFSVLLHEFAHVAANNAPMEKELAYYNWLCNGGNPNFYSGLISLLFLYPDITYVFHHSLCQYASSLINETMADQIMGTLGNANCAASALVKIKYYDLFSWEKGTYDKNCFYMPEELSKTFLETEISELKNGISERKETWNTLIEDEILSRSASHPTLKMRLNTLGITSLETLESNDSESYRQECIKAVQRFEELIYTENVEHYKDNRNLYYLEPLKVVNDWETSGKPLIPEEYSDIDQALRKLGRNHEANQLCDRAISELNDAANCYAYFMKGCFLLHSYDASGIDFIYHAIENNSNYIEEGLDVIGEFCCLVGRKDDLETYRQRAVEITQKKKDVYDESTVLRKTDHLTAENLPDELHNSIMQYIFSIEDNHIQKIYLVRKTITNDFFTSAFIIQFKNGTSAKIQNKVLYKVFSYLDTCSDWQFSLFEYNDVKNIKFDEIENSCIYSK